jgi:hypothetical protein
VAVELVILYQPSLAGCFNWFLMCHNKKYFALLYFTQLGSTGLQLYIGMLRSALLRLTKLGYNFAWLRFARLYFTLLCYTALCLDITLLRFALLCCAPLRFALLFSTFLYYACLCLDVTMLNSAKVRSTLQGSSELCQTTLCFTLLC